MNIKIFFDIYYKHKLNFFIYFIMYSNSAI